VRFWVLEPIRVVIVGSQLLVRAGLRTLINSWPNFDVVGELPCDRDSRTQLSRLADIILVDIDCGADQLRRLRSAPAVSAL
jgi:DNA-binding NarL/FixJ family response regulator